MNNLPTELPALKSPPSHFNAEYFTITAAVSRPDFLKKVNLKEEHFFHPSTRRAYNALKTLIANDTPITLVNFGSELYDQKGKVSEFSANIDPLSENNSEKSFLSNVKMMAKYCALRKVYDILSDFNGSKEAVEGIIAKAKEIENDFITPKAKDVDESFADFMSHYADMKKSLAEGRTASLVTGFKSLDDIYMIEEGNLVIIAAKTSVGKTAFSLNVAVNASMYDQKVIFVSAEMTQREIYGRVISQLTGVSASRLKTGQADAALALARNQLPKRDNFKVVEAGNMSSTDIAQVCRETAASSGKIDLIVVDYIQYLKDPMKSGQTNNDRIGQITRNLKGLAMELRCPVIALSQVNRTAEGLPQLHHLRDSGNIEQDADMVMILHREEQGGVKQPATQLVIGKNRNGATGSAKLIFDAQTTKFTEVKKLYGID